VEFVRTGQEAWHDWSDPRFSVTLMHLGPVTKVKPSYIRKVSEKSDRDNAQVKINNVVVVAYVDTPIMCRKLWVMFITKKC